MSDKVQCKSIQFTMGTFVPVNRTLTITEALERDQLALFILVEDCIYVYCRAVADIWLANIFLATLHSVWSECITEPPHDKTNKMACAPSEDSDQSLRCVLSG